MKKIITFAAALCVVLATALGSEPIRIYHIGNSLTWDSKPTTQASILEENGYAVSQGYHIACGQSLTSIVSNPDNTCVSPPEPFGKWENALTNYEWDAVTIQAYPGGTGVSEVAATAAIIEEAISGERNQNCIFFLYLAWPTTSESSSFADRVLSPFGDGDAPVFLSSGFLDYWESEVRSLFPDLDIRVIPTGVAFATIDNKLREIEISPYTNTYDLYRDVHHMNLTEGRHVAMSTMLSSITGIRTRDIIYPASYFSSYNSSFVELSNEVVWFTITNDPRTRISIEPEIQVKSLGSSIVELSFLGTLWESENLQGWNMRDDVTSPYRININNQSQMLYRSANE